LPAVAAEAGEILLFVLLLLTAYLIGSIPVGVLVGRVAGFDPRAVGSGNVGMTNVARAGGTRAAAITFAGDMLKGLVPVLIARTAQLEVTQLLMVAFAAFVGSISSIFLRFSGGRGVSTALGVWLGLAPIVIPVAMVVFAAVLGISRRMSLASIAAAIALPPIVAALSYPKPYVVLAIAISALVIWRHRANMGRLLRGDEPPLWGGAKKAT